MIKHGCEPFFVRQGGAYSNLAEQYNAFCNKMQDEHKSFCVTGQELITTTHDPVLVVFYTYEPHEPATGATQRLEPGEPQHVLSLHALRDDRDRRHTFAVSSAQRRNRRSAFDGRGELSWMYFVAYSDAVDDVCAAMERARGENDV